METALNVIEDSCSQDFLSSAYLRARVQDDTVATLKKAFNDYVFIDQQLNTLNEGYRNVVERLDFVSFFKEEPYLITKSPSNYSYKTTSVLDLMSYIKNHIDFDLAKRLHDLRQAAFDEEPEQSLISSDSLRNFIGFINSNTNLVKPELMLSPAGNICAEWHRSKKEHFVLEFLPTGQVHYVVFGKDKDYPSRTERTWGVVSSNSVMGKVIPFNVLSWASY